MPAPRKYDEETRARAVRMYTERIRDLGESKLTARRAVGALLDINPATLRTWAEREEIDTGARPGVTTEASEELKALRREVAELRRANEILTTASAFFASAELLANLGARRGGTAAGADLAEAPGPLSLSEVLETFCTAARPPVGPPPAAVAVDSLLDQVPGTGIVVRGRDVVGLLRPVYRALAERAATTPLRADAELRSSAP